MLSIRWLLVPGLIAMLFQSACSGINSPVASDVNDEKQMILEEVNLTTNEDRLITLIKKKKRRTRSR